MQLVTLYYPAAWLRGELKEAYGLDSGQVVRSQPHWQVQRLGPDLLWEFYDWKGPDRQWKGPDHQAVRRVVPVPHLRPPATCLQAPLPLGVLPAQEPRLSAQAAFGPRYAAWERLRSPSVSKYGLAAELRYKKALEQHLRRGPTLHLLGETDTLTGTFRRQRRLVKTDANGRSVVKGALMRLYAPDGSLRNISRKMRRYKVERDYEHGRLVHYQKSYYDKDRRWQIREWDAQGRLLYDARRDRHGDTHSRRRDRHGHLPLRRRLQRPGPGR